VIGKMGEPFETKIVNIGPATWLVEGKVTRHHIGLVCIECSNKTDKPIEFVYVEDLDIWMCPKCKRFVSFNLTPIHFLKPSETSNKTEEEGGETEEWLKP